MLGSLSRNENITYKENHCSKIKNGYALEEPAQPLLLGAKLHRQNANIRKDDGLEGLF